MTSLEGLCRLQLWILSKLWHRASKGKGKGREEKELCPYVLLTPFLLPSTCSNLKHHQFSAIAQPKSKQRKPNRSDMQVDRQVCDLVGVHFRMIIYFLLWHTPLFYRIPIFEDLFSCFIQNAEINQNYLYLLNPLKRQTPQPLLAICFYYSRKELNIRKTFPKSFLHIFILSSLI